MARIQRVGDPDTGGGRILSGDNSVLVNGIPIAVVNAPVSSHPRGPQHNNARTQATVNTSVFVNGRLIVVTGDLDTCGHARAGGSPDTGIG